MSNTRGTIRRRRSVGTVLAIGAAGTLLAAGCTRPGGGGSPWTLRPPTTTPTTDGHGHTDHDHANLTTTTVMDHGGGGMDHGGMDHGGATGSGHHIGFDHPPTEAQQAAARDLIKRTRDAVRGRFVTVAQLQAAGYFTIGDALTGTNHFVKPAFHRDATNLNPNAIESFAVRNGRVVAAMYVLTNGSKSADVPDLAGNWTQWHDHTLPFQSANPNLDAYYRLGGTATRQTAPMLHVWITANACGPFAGTDNMNMTGACHPEAEPTPAGYVY
jgi:hypothetical protein